MAKKSIYGNKGILIGAALLGGYVLYKGVTNPRDGDPKDGSIGGTDELLEHQGFDVDPNSVPEQPYESYPEFYVITPEGQVEGEPTVGAGSDGGAGIPSNIPIASTGTGSLFQDAAATGGAIGGNLMLPSIAKRITKLVDTKYLTSTMDDVVKQSPWQKFIKDPYGLKSFDDLAIEKVTKTGSREVAELSIDKSGKTILKTIPKWAKATKTVANFIPLLDIPIGAGLDVYFNRYEDDPNKKINWADAIAANTAGELAQLGIMAGGAAAGTVVPVAGNIAGGVTGFVVGTGADIAATEAYYLARGKSSLFSGSSQGSSYTPNTSVQNTALAKLTGQGNYDFANQTYTTPSGNKQSMSAANYLKTLTAPKSSPNTSTSSSSSSSSRSQSSSQSKANSTTSAFMQLISAPVVNPFAPKKSSSSSSGSSSRKSSSSNASSSRSTTPKTSSVSTSARTSSTAKSSAPRTAPRTSVVSRVISAPRRTVSAVKSVASRVSSWFRRR